MPATQDKFVNVLLDSVTMSAANTLTYKAINIGLSTFDRIGLLLHRVSFYPSAASIGDMVTALDYYQIAITASNTPTSIGSDERSVLVKVENFLNHAGAATSAWINRYPQDVDLCDMPGGGLLVPPRPLYIAAYTSGFAAAAKFFARIYFTTVQLKDADYFELLETFRFFE